MMTSTPAMGAIDGPGIPVIAATGLVFSTSLPSVDFAEPAADFIEPPEFTEPAAEFIEAWPVEDRADDDVFTEAVCGKATYGKAFSNA